MMEKSKFDKRQVLKSYEVNELSENGIIPRLIVITDMNAPDEVELSDGIIAELKEACQPQSLPYVIATIENGIAVPFEYRKRKP